jgi:acetyl esterase/lipase
MKKLSLSLLAGAAWLLTIAPLAAQEQAPAPTPPAGVVFEADVEYGEGGGEKLKLDLARPENLDRPAPCIVVIHGGAWRAGNKTAHHPQIFDFAGRGYVAATVGYRFCPTHRFPAQVEDVKCAVRFLRANAEKYNIDPNRVGAIGFSAGAHLSMMLGATDAEDGLEGAGGHADQSSQVQVVVQFFGPTDFNGEFPEVSEGLINDFVGGTRADNTEARKRASPLTYLDSGDAPILTFQGTKDPLVPHSQAFKLAEAMSAAGVGGRVEILPGAAHGWGNPELARTVAAAHAFLAEHLKPGE